MSRKFVEYFSSGAFWNQFKAADGDTTSPVFYGMAGQGCIKSICKKFVDRITEVQKDKLLSSEGKQIEIAKAARQGLKELRGGYMKFIEPLQRQFTNFETTNLPALRSTTDPLSAIRIMELRQFLATCSGGQKLNVFQSALANDDAEILGCFFERSDLFQLLAPDIIAKGKKEYMQKHCPQVLAAEKCGASLEYCIKKTAEDLSLYDNEINEDSVAIWQNFPKVNWQFDQSDQNFEAMKFNHSTSDLPRPSPAFGTPANTRTAMAQNQ